MTYYALVKELWTKRKESVGSYEENSSFRDDIGHINCMLAWSSSSASFMVSLNWLGLCEIFSIDVKMRIFSVI